MASRISVRNEHRSCRLDERLVERIAGHILRILGEEAALEFLFTDRRAIRAMNRRFKDCDRPTDVLSFRLDCGSAGCIGHIAISLDAARMNSRRFGTAPGDEVIRYVIHGILHFLGYRDSNAAGRVRMNRKETEILQILCMKEHLSKVLTRR